MSKKTGSQLSSCVTVRLYGELNDFLPVAMRQKDIILPVSTPVSVKHVVEAIGVPHTEVNLILINGKVCDFDSILQPDDRVSVYPVFKSIDISSLNLLRPAPLRQACFVVDGHLGRLAVYLRLLGFDTLYDPAADDSQLAHLSSNQNRILLTRDRGLLKRSEVTRGYAVRSSHPREQILEVCWHYDLWDQFHPFWRCLSCNGLLESVARDEISDQLQENTRLYYNEFHRCVECGKIYWKGSHYQKMKRLVAWLVEQYTPRNQ